MDCSTSIIFRTSYVSTCIHQKMAVPLEEHEPYSSILGNFCKECGIESNNKFCCKYHCIRYYIMNGLSYIFIDICHYIMFVSTILCVILSSTGVISPTTTFIVFISMIGWIIFAGLYYTINHIRVDTYSNNITII